MIEMNLSIGFPIQKKSNPLADLKQLLFSKSLGDPDQILFSILKTDVGQDANVLFELSSKNKRIILEDDKIFNRFLNRHKSMKYGHLFGQNKSTPTFFTREKKVKNKVVCRETKPILKNQAHPAQIRENCAIIMHKVISPSLYGNDRNKKKILKALYNMMQTARSESFNLVSLVERINIDSITWLTIEDKELKLIFVAKFLKWIFRFFTLLICKYYNFVYVKEQRVFLFIQDCNKEVTKYLATQNKKGILEKLKGCENINAVNIKMYIIPKINGFRSIAIGNKYTYTEKQDLRKIVSVLTFIHDEYLKSDASSFEEAYIDIVREAKYSKKTFYVTSIDIRNAFGSIIQNKLFDILTSLFNRLPEVIELCEFSKRGGKTYKYGYPQFIKGKCGKKVTVQRGCIFQKLEDIIFHTKIKIRGKVYQICKGIAQGLILSSKLCDIYYQTMQQKYFTDFRNSGFIYTHVDDTIYFTTNEKFANEFLERVKKGISEYNCWFEQTKLTTNIPSNSAAGDNVDQKLKFLQWSIDSPSLELEPTFKSAMRYSMRYSSSVTVINLLRRLINVEAIKLKKLVLYKEINSREKILNNIHIIAERQARRCFAIANNLNNKQDMTFNIIQATNNQIIKKINKAACWTEMEKFENKREIYYIFWKAYYSVFRKSNSFLLLVKSFKKMMGKYNPKKKYMYRSKPFVLIRKRPRLM